MRVSCINTRQKVYSSNVYFVRGNHNALPDMNTLIDTGSTGFVVNDIHDIHTGVGKKKIDQVILTHGHFDHTGGLQEIKKTFSPTIYARAKIKGVDRVVKDGDILKIGDDTGHILNIPDHSNDSICILCKASKIAFTGDTPILGIPENREFTAEYISFIKQLFKYDIRTIYPGHGTVIKMTPQKILRYFEHFF